LEKGLISEEEKTILSSFINEHSLVLKFSKKIKDETETFLETLGKTRTIVNADYEKMKIKKKV
jgi:hypothetical protein